MRVAVHDKPITTNGPVLNVIIADAAYCDSHYPDKWRNVDDEHCGPGFLWDAKSKTYQDPELTPA